MKRIKVIVCLVFVVSCVLFGVSTVKSMLTEDHNAPVIIVEEKESFVSVETLEEDLLTGVTATDKENGDITDKIQVASISRLMSGGKRAVKYIVFDSANNLGTAEKTVVYTDYIPPRIYLTEPLRYTVDYVSDASNKMQMTADDAFDGDITNKIQVSFGSDVSLKPGVYPVTFQVTNSAGDTCSVACELAIINLSDPVEVEKFYPELSEYIVYTKVNNELDFRLYLTGISGSTERYVFGGASTPANISADKVEIDSSNMNYQTPGVYEVNYSYTTRGGVKATTILYVVVEE